MSEEGRVIPFPTQVALPEEAKATVPFDEFVATEVVDLQDKVAALDSLDEVAFWAAFHEIKGQVQGWQAQWSRFVMERSE